MSEEQCPPSSPTLPSDALPSPQFEVGLQPVNTTNQGIDRCLILSPSERGASSRSTQIPVLYSTLPGPTPKVLSRDLFRCHISNSHLVDLARPWPWFASSTNRAERLLRSPTVSSPRGPMAISRGTRKLRRLPTPRGFRDDCRSLRPPQLFSFFVGALRQLAVPGPTKIIYNQQHRS